MQDKFIRVLSMEESSKTMHNIVSKLARYPYLNTRIGAYSWCWSECPRRHSATFNTSSTFWSKCRIRDISKTHIENTIQKPFKMSSGWWFQPNWKICSSKWVHLPKFWDGHKKYLSCHHLENCRSTPNPRNAKRRPWRYQRPGASKTDG